MDFVRLVMSGRPHQQYMPAYESLVGGMMPGGRRAVSPDLEEGQGGAGKPPEKPDKSGKYTGRGMVGRKKQTAPQESDIDLWDREEQRKKFMRLSVDQLKDQAQTHSVDIKIPGKKANKKVPIENQCKSKKKYKNSFH